MKIHVITFLFLMLSLNGAAQWKQGEVPVNTRRNTKIGAVLDTTQIIAYYAFNADSIDNPETYIDFGWLQIGKKHVKYASYFMAVSDSTYKEYSINRPKNTGSVFAQTNGGKHKSYWSEYQYDEIFINNGKLTEYAIMSLNLGPQNCWYSEDYPMQKWTLCNETSTILSYKCQKAICRWRGRDYEAWFTTEIPARYGPWKFGGLPGLIIKIQDSRKEYTFECVKVEQAKRPIIQYDHSHLKEVKRENMLKLQKKINQDWMKVLGVLDMKGNSVSKFTEYSPMELE